MSDSFLLSQQVNQWGLDPGPHDHGYFGFYYGGYESLCVYPFAEEEERLDFIRMVFAVTHDDNYIQIATALALSQFGDGDGVQEIGYELLMDLVPDEDTRELLTESANYYVNENYALEAKQ